MKAERFEIKSEVLTVVIPESKYELIKNKICKFQGDSNFQFAMLEKFVTLNGGWIKDF
jgi:hypothetical protein